MCYGINFQFERPLYMNIFTTNLKGERLERAKEIYIGYTVLLM